MSRHLSTLLILAALLVGCAHIDATGEPSYATDAEQNFALGAKALEDGRHLDAMKYFEHVRYKFPYSAQAALADLAVADTFFEQEKYLEAIDGYRSFLKLRPNHPKSDYAEFRVAFSFYKDIPSDFFLFPPAIEKDQTAVREALSALKQFLQLYPTSSLATEATRLLAEVRERLAGHEMYVANFYIHRERWHAVVGRLDKLLADFPDSALRGEAALKLANAHLKLGENDKARAVLERLIREHPEDPYRSDAEGLLKSLS